MSQPVQVELDAQLIVEQAQGQEQEATYNTETTENNDDDESLTCSFPGGPTDLSVLSSFNTHVAVAIWEGQERDVLKCHCLTTKLLKWRYINDSSTTLWRALVKSSKLMRLRTMSYKGPNRNLISAFVERWHPETNSFHFPFGEMSITLEDVHMLTGLDITGSIVHSSGGDRDDESGLDTICRILGVTDTDATLAVNDKSGSSIKLNWLRSRFASTISTDNDIIALHAARAFLLYIIGCTIFTDKSGERVSTIYLRLFEDPNKFGSYAWGVAALAFLYRQLGLTSRVGVK